jgi:hypothetical protein
MATVFKNLLSTGVIGPTPTTVLTTNATASTTVIGLSMTNTTGNVIQVSILIQDTVAGTQAYYINNFTIPTNTSARVVTGGEKLIMGPSTNVIMTSNSAGSVDLVMSWVEIS